MRARPILEAVAIIFIWCGNDREFRGRRACTTPVAKAGPSSPPKMTNEDLTPDFPPNPS
jgi:hypothetical protein